MMCETTLVVDTFSTGVFSFVGQPIERHKLMWKLASSMNAQFVKKFVSAVIHVSAQKYLFSIVDGLFRASA
jgi:hypothetical protein